jgi:hypothetical protein
MRTSVALVVAVVLALSLPAPTAAGTRPPPELDALGWTPEGYIDPSGGEAQRTQIGLDDTGAPIAVWAGRSLVAAPHEIRFSRFDGTGWSATAPAFAPSALQNQLPRMSRAPDGTLWIAWLRYGDPVSGTPTLFSVVMAARRVGGAWSEPETVAVQAPLPRRDILPSEFSILAEGPDDAWVVFAKNSGADPFSQSRGLYSVRRTSGGWGAPTLIQENGLTETRPELAAGPGGRPVVIFGFALSRTLLAARAWNGSAWEQGPEDTESAIAFYEHGVQPDTSGAVRVIAFVREDVSGDEVDHVREYVWNGDGFIPGPVVLQAAVVEGGSKEGPDWAGLSLATAGPCTGCPAGTPPLFRPLWVDFSPGSSPRVFTALRTAEGYDPIDVAGTALEPSGAYPNATYDASLDRWYAAWSGPPNVVGLRRAKFAWTQRFAGDVGIGASLADDEITVELEVVCSDDATGRAFRIYRLPFPGTGNAPLAPPIPAAAVEIAGSPFAGPCPLTATDAPGPGRYFYYAELVAAPPLPGDFSRTFEAVVLPEDPGGGDDPDVTAFGAPYPQPAYGGLVSFPFDLASPADDVRIVIHDLVGRVVRRIALGALDAGSYRESLGRTGRRRSPVAGGRVLRAPVGGRQRTRRRAAHRVRACAVPAVI